MRIRTGSLLVLLVAGVQALCLFAGHVWYARQVEQQLAGRLCDAALQEQGDRLAVLAETIEADGAAAAARLVAGANSAAAGVGLSPILLIESTTGCESSAADGRADALRSLLASPAAQALLGRARDGRPAAAVIDGPSTRWLMAAHGISGTGTALVTAQPQGVVLAAAQGLARSMDRVALVGLVVLGVLSVLATMLIVRRYESKLAHLNVGLEQEVTRRSSSLVRTRDAVIFGLAKLAEFRDDETGAHLERIRAYTELLARRLAERKGGLDDEYIERLGLISSLHDIGKVGIPDAVLQKPGTLTTEERLLIEKHPLIGGDCLTAIKDLLGEDDFLETACEITFAHHERWDGKGYPFGLTGEQIPLAARIVALADTYDALTTRRVYKPAFSHQTARQIIVEGSGTRFDPEVVEAFLAAEEEFRRVAERFAQRNLRQRVREMLHNPH